MAVNSPQPTLLCVITLSVCLSSLNDHNVPFLDFVVCYYIIRHRFCFSHPVICGEWSLGEFGDWPRHLGEGRGRRRSSQRRLSDGENYAHVCSPRQSSCAATACGTPSPSTFSAWRGGQIQDGFSPLVAAGITLSNRLFFVLP